MQLKSLSWIIKGVLCVVVLMIGWMIAGGLIAQRKPPPQAQLNERAVRVQVQTARFEDVPVMITGFGEVRTRDISRVAPGIGGQVVAVHPRLEVGEIIRAGEVLFKIDPRDYQARLDEAQSAVLQLDTNIKRIRKQHSIDKNRLKTFERSRDLAKEDFERSRRLLANDSIESQSVVDAREMTYNNAEDQYALLAQSIDLFALRLLEAESNLASANATKRRAEADMDRTVVETDVDLRVKEVSLELHQYLSPADVVLTLADDSVLEIAVPINSREARKWLRFNKNTGSDTRAWFNDLTRVPVKVAWTEAPDEHIWKGTVHRVERFNEKTRTLTVIVRVEGSDAVSPKAGNMPLVEGMFCRMEIPGETATRVVKLPTEAVAFDREATGYQTVYVVNRHEETGEVRLKSKAVKESHIAGDFIYISEGLEAGDLVITTRLINPLENILLELEEPVTVESD